MGRCRFRSTQQFFCSLSAILLQHHALNGPPKSLISARSFDGSDAAIPTLPRVIDGR
jgi:hypothetical protein